MSVTLFLRCHVNVGVTYRDLGGDWTRCRCRIHEVVECGVVGGRGCTGWRSGTHRSIAALYGSDGPVKFCHAEPGVRKLDRAFLKFVLRNCFKVRSQLIPGGWPPALVYGKGVELAVEWLGAGYCYTAALIAVFRMRVARLLGPLPFLINVLRFVLVCGVAVGPELDLVKVGPGLYHVEVKGTSVDLNAGFKFVGQVMKVLRAEGPQVRVGASRMSETELREWLLAGLQGSSCAIPGLSADRGDSVDGLEGGKTITTSSQAGVPDSVVRGVYSLSRAVGLSQVSLTPAAYKQHVECGRVQGLVKALGTVGVHIPKMAWADLAVVTVAPVHLAKVFAPMKERKRLMEVLGDVALKELAAVSVLAEGGLMASYTRILDAQRNSELGKVLRSSSLIRWFVVEGLSEDSKVFADMIEGTIGTVAYWSTSQSVHSLALHLKLVTRVEPRHVKLTFQLPSEVESQARVEELERQVLEMREMLSQVLGRNG